jgi:hypothetical protein
MRPEPERQSHGSQPWEEVKVDGCEPTWTERSAPLCTLVVETAPLGEILRRRQVAPQEVALVWADIQGAEGKLIESSPELWQAGVPLHVELWPGGLLHQGTDRLPRACRRHFRSFVHELIAQPRSPRRQPIAELRTLHDALLKQGHEAHSDVLLLNAEPGEAARAAER